MNDQEARLIKDLKELLQANDITIESYDQLDEDEFYMGTVYYLTRDNVSIDIDDLTE